jgi:dolichyl-phosphate-mannose-protein mannosyltransferase
MLSANARIETPHHWMSKWWSWPINSRGVLYFAENTKGGEQRMVYLLGNPAVSWLVGGVLVFAVALLVIGLRYRRDTVMRFRRPTRQWFCVIAFLLFAYFVNIAPYMAVDRAAFIYHYMPALFYGILLTAVTLDRVIGRVYFPVVSQAILTGVIACYIYFAPWVYCLPRTKDWHTRRRWLEGWT